MILPGFWVLLAVSLFVGAGEVLPLAVLAAAFHELGHLLALSAFGVRAEEVRLSAFGAEIRADTRYLSYGKDILCTLAGPFVNILLGLVLSRVSGDYLFAGANLLQGVFNLLPLSGLDGARAMNLLVSWFIDPVAADRFCSVLEMLCAAVFAVVAVYLVIRHGTGVFLLLTSAGILHGTLRGRVGK